MVENQYPEKLIPKFIKQLKKNKKVTIQGDGSNIRAFLHANDTAKAFECILEKGIIGEIYNIGCDSHLEYSVMYVEDRPYNDKRYYISNDKLKNLGWEIKVDLDEGLNRLI